MKNSIQVVLVRMVLDSSLAPKNLLKIPYFSAFLTESKVTKAYSIKIYQKREQSLLNCSLE